MQNNFSKVTADIINLKNICKKNSSIEEALYRKYEVNRGLRDINGKVYLLV